MTAYAPTVFRKGDKTATARTWIEHYQYLFEGWTVGVVAATDSGVVENAYETLIASAHDRTNVAVALASNTYGYLAPMISVPPQTGPVALFYGANVICTVAGTGIIGIGVADCSDKTIKAQGLASRSGTFALGTFAQLLGSVEGNIVIDPSPNWRHYRLIGCVFRDSGSLAASQSLSRSGGGPSYQPDDREAYLRAVKL